MIDRLHYKVVGLAILFLLCWMGFSPLACRGAVVWSDDFNTGFISDDWTICDNSTIVGGGGSNWSAANDYLQLEQEDWGIISHPSNVAYGTWSFDFKADETQVRGGALAGFSFISGNLYDWPTLGYSNIYYLSFDAISTDEGFEMRLRLAKRISGAQSDIEYSEDLVPITGWHHIDVTRTTAGLFSVYHNGSLVVQAADTDLDTSVMFWLLFRYGSMTDNILVDDTPPIDSLVIVIIGASAVVIIAVVLIFLKRR